MKKNDKLKGNYVKSCNEIVELFCKKQDLDFEFWVGDAVGEVASCGSYYFSLKDIILDLDKDLKKGIIIQWYNDSFGSLQKYMNYNSYTMGLRYEDLK